MKKILFLLIFLNTFLVKGQCDISINDFNFTTGELVVEVINSENCGCNDLTDIETSCNTSSSGSIQNNETISHIVLGLHLDGFDYQWTDCVSGNNHPGWTFKSKSFFGNSVLETGDTWSTNIYDFYDPTNDCWSDILSNNEECVELVIWQINLSQTSEVADGGWAVNPNVANQTQNYPDFNLLDNVVTMCPVVFPGCTDPFALNYNEDATEDDGTCVFSIGPDPIIIDVTISEEECEVFDAGILSSFVYEATLVNIGTEAVTNFCLSDFLGTTFNCFNGVSNLAVWIQPGDTITVSGTINGAGTWISGQGNYFTITSVPNEIITGNNNFVFNMVTGVDCELPPPSCDTIYVTETEFLTDTIYVTETEFLTDTIYVTETEFLTDTLYITQTLTDTVEVLVDNYIYETDTLTVIETQLIDCETGEECVDPPGLSECWPWTVYIPNTFTPNNDGINDIWQIIYDLDCWVDVEFKIFNRWGSQIYYGFVEDFETYPYWDGSINGGDYYVSDGVYLYTFYGRKSDSPEILEESGHITIFR